MLDFKKVTIILLVLLITSLGGFFYMYTKVSSVKAPPKTEKEQIALLIAQVGKLMILPQEEEPTLATVSDPEKLRGQAFFANAKVGDKVLIYQRSGKAILYSPTLNRIVEVSPINITTETPNTNTTPVATTTATTTKTATTAKKK